MVRDKSINIQVIIMKQLIKTIVLICICAISYSAYAQNSSRQNQLKAFERLFPQKLGQNLYSIQKLKLEDMSKSDTLSIELANNLIWYGNHPSQIRKSDNTLKKYFNAYLGRFSFTEGWGYDEDKKDWVQTGEYSKLYPIAKIDIL